MQKNGKTCLIVEDDPDDQEIFQMALTEAGAPYQCIFTNNASDALQKLKQNLFNPDYIFIDLNMPKLNGLQCLVEIRKHPQHLHTPVVIYSTSSEETHISQAMGLGASAFIIKPSSITLLANALNNFFKAH